MAVADDELSSEARPDLGLTGRSNPDARMPLMEHIRDLRNRVIKIAIVVTIGSVIGWVVYGHVFSFIEQPFCRLPASMRSIPSEHVAGSDCGHELIVTGIFDAFFLQLQISIVTGVILSSPVWL